MNVQAEVQETYVKSFRKTAEDILLGKFYPYYTYGASVIKYIPLRINALLCNPKIEIGLFKEKRDYFL